MHSHHFLVHPARQPALQAPHANSVSVIVALTVAYHCLLLVCCCCVQVVQLCLQLQCCLLRVLRHLLLGLELLQQHTFLVLCALLLVPQLLCLPLDLSPEQQLPVPLCLLLRGLGVSGACLQQQHSHTYTHMGSALSQAQEGSLFAVHNMLVIRSSCLCCTDLGAWGPGRQNAHVCAAVAAFLLLHSPRAVVAPWPVLHGSICLCTVSISVRVLGRSCPHLAGHLVALRRDRVVVLPTFPHCAHLQAVGGTSTVGDACVSVNTADQDCNRPAEGRRQQQKSSHGWQSKLTALTAPDASANTNCVIMVSQYTKKLLLSQKSVAREAKAENRTQLLGGRRKQCEENTQNRLPDRGNSD